ncbi:MAG TPA: serine/threonine-protein kinase [Gemmatimonadaceae bacterium]|nr:serine/threonine-protein kinase [Gemmatimonadaceae bacterium]
MPQPPSLPPSPLPTPTPPPLGTLRRADTPSRPSRLEQQVRAVETETAGRLSVLASLGALRVGGRPTSGYAFLARESGTGSLLVATVTQRRGSGRGRGYRVSLARELNASLPGPASACPYCGDTVVGWARHCSCGADLFGIAPASAAERAQLMEHARQATVGEFEILGEIPCAAGGGLAYFAAGTDDGVVVALRMHRDGTFDDGTPRIVLTASEPLATAGRDELVTVERSPHSGPVRFTPVDSIGVVTDETAAREISQQTEASRAEQLNALGLPLRGSILGSGLLAQQPTPAESEAVAVAKVCPQCGAEYDTASRFCPNDGTPLRPKGTTDPYIGRVLADRYHMLKRIGEGGMGRVYLAEHVKMNRQCAVKVMSGALLNDAESAQRFAREASNAARIIHPNVAAVFDYGESEGVVYLVMEYVEGESLTRIMEREAPLPPARAVELARQVAEALVTAHEMAIVHRDLKPDNILVTRTKAGREVAKVVDFGIAKALEEGPQESLTKTGLVIGTPEYMSPEQLLGDPVDARSDIYSLGCILFQMLTGRRAFDEPTREQMIKRRLTEKAPHPHDLVPALPKTLDLIVARMLGRSPQDRYATAAEVRDVLIPAIALEGGFEDVSWRPMTRSNPTVFIRAAEQPTQEMTPFAGITMQHVAWRRSGFFGAMVVGVLALGVGAGALVRHETRSSSLPNVTVDSAARSAIPKRAALVPPAARSEATPTSTVKKAPDSARPAATKTAENKVPRVPDELRAPIGAYLKAIESGLVEKMIAVYPRLSQEEAQKQFWDDYFRRNEHMNASVQFNGWERTGGMAYIRLQLRVKARAAGGTPSLTQTPPMLNLRYKVTLVKVGSEWKIQQLQPGQTSSGREE